MPATVSGHGLTVIDLRGALVGPVSFTLAPGDCMALMGPSGSGKSSVLRLVADLDPGEGTVTLGGVDRGDMPAAQWRRRVMLVPAQAGWWTERVADHFPASHESEARRWMQAMGLRPALFERVVASLSTGERQRLALIRAMVTAPSVLLLDEPTSGLDEETTRQVEACLDALRGLGTALLLVTHDVAQGRRLSSRLYRLQNGTMATMS